MSHEQRNIVVELACVVQVAKQVSIVLVYKRMYVRLLVEGGDVGSCCRIRPACIPSNIARLVCCSFSCPALSLHVCFWD